MKGFNLIKGIIAARGKVVNNVEESSKTTHEKEERTEYWKKHPDPQAVRETWMTLNGVWSLNHKPIRVPFCPEAELSGFMGDKDELSEHMYYKTSFTVDRAIVKWKNTRFMLHFDGVDQKFTATLNDMPIGFHEDGYSKAVFDVTDAIVLKKENVLKVIAVDKLDKSLPYGKQKKKRGGMWYTPCSGIWKSVWLEAVPERHITGLEFRTTLNSLHIDMNFNDFPAETVKIKISAPVILSDLEKNAGNDKNEVATVLARIDQEIMKNGMDIDLSTVFLGPGRPIPVKNWSCGEPWLYFVTIEAGEDSLQSYFGLRTVSIKKIGGVKRIFLNDRPVFFHGVLDQGYFTDGLYLPREEEEYERDILRMKNLGFNMLRKHVKVESDWFYYYCDVHGMLVMQDMVNSGTYRYLRDTIFPTFGFKINDEKLRAVSSKRRHNFMQHVKNVRNAVFNHPSVVCYTIFNEGWGQHTSAHYFKLLRIIDDTRLIDTASGWFSGAESDFDSRHIYFHLEKIGPKENQHGRPIIISECGGYSYAEKGHMQKVTKTYGYGICRSKKELTGKIVKLYDDMIIPGIKAGVAGCIYTQLSDVEDEINGIYTYDREVLKADKSKLVAVRDRIDDALIRVCSVKED